MSQLMPTIEANRKSLVWDGSNFGDPTLWTPGRTSAYPGLTNPNDDKLDYLSGIAPSHGVFTANRRADGYWDTSLVSTESTPNGFELLPGDSVVADVFLYATMGIWPALWTWGRDTATGPQTGHGELDFFEYHGDNPYLLEISNHVRPSTRYIDGIVIPGQVFTMRVDITTATVNTYINGTLVSADRKGVPSNWRAWPIVNISVSAGKWHPKPADTQTHMEFAVTRYQVYR